MERRIKNKVLWKGIRKSNMKYCEGGENKGGSEEYPVSKQGGGTSLLKWRRGNIYAKYMQWK